MGDDSFFSAGSFGIHDLFHIVSWCRNGFRIRVAAAAALIKAGAGKEAHRRSGTDKFVVVAKNTILTAAYITGNSPGTGGCSTAGMVLPP